MKTLAILTPDPAEARYEGRWQAAFTRLASAFGRLEVDVAATPWTASPPQADAALAILCWGYHFRLQDWSARLEAGGPPLINAVGVLQWNTRKTYLLELAAAGVSVVPTQAFDAATPERLEQAFDAFACDTLVVKPQVSAGSHLTVRVARGRPAPPLPRGPVLVQPFLPAVGQEGELSLFYFGGRFSHAARKVAAAGDFRIQPQFGGVFSPLQPEAEAFATAAAALAAAPTGITYARVDLIRGADGRLALMELEAIEPDIYLDLSPDAADRFAHAVVGAMRA